MADQTAVLVPAHLVFDGKDYIAWRMRVQREIQFVWKCPKVLADIPQGENAADREARETEENKAFGLLCT